MNEARFERLQDLVADALECPPLERAAFLQTACSEDPELLAEAKSLLAYEQRGDDLLENSALLRFTVEGQGLRIGTNQLQPGDRLGDYRITSLLGEGGMGEVYLADDTRLKRPVALKLLKRRLGDAVLRRRFDHERDVLAALNHPNIARLYGADTTPEDSSYLVMEYVAGERLDRFCDTRRLRLNERLQLFRKICAAVAYAHQNLVVHRDLKPANIRVEPEGEPKLLDFGIAKLLDPEGTQGVDPTVTMFAAMTPEYASPEQVRGGPTTTASDVYSLGVVLYELLTGQRPHHLKSRRPDELARAICEEEPPRPSTVAANTAARDDGWIIGGETPARLQRLLRGDLDNIIAKALAKEPARRYASVAQFSEDIRRHGEGLPVSARRDTLRYRAHKFVRRNRVLVGAAALIILALVGGLIATLREARRANRRFEDVRRLANSILFELEPQISRLSGSTQARGTLVKRSLEYLNDLSQEAGGNRELRRELATAYEKIGNVQGNPTVSSLGDLKSALVSLHKARDMRLALVADDPRDARARQELATSYENLGDVAWWSDDTDGALKNYRACLDLRRALMAEQPQSLEHRKGLGSVLICLADVHTFSNQLDEAMTYLREALPALQAVADGAPDNVDARSNLVRGWVRLGIAYRDSGDFAAARAEFERSAGTMEAVVARAPDNQSSRLEQWYVAYCQCELFRDQPDVAQGLAMGPRMIGLIEALIRGDPKNASVEHDLATSQQVYGGILLRAERWQEAADALQKAIDVDTKLAAQSPENGEYPHGIGVYHLELGAALLGLGRFAEAEAEETQAQSFLKTCIDKDASNVTARRELVRATMRRGTIREKRQQPAESQQLFRQALIDLEAIIAKNPANKEDTKALAELRSKLAVTPQDMPTK